MKILITVIAVVALAALVLKLYLLNPAIALVIGTIGFLTVIVWNPEGWSGAYRYLCPN
jgi:hypothetical protein